MIPSLVKSAPSIIATTAVIAFTVPVNAAEDYDPFEKTNRKIFAFNDYLDRNLLVPVAKGYNAITPRVVNNGISNAYSNALEPLTTVNDVAQLKFGRGVTAVSRFVVNSTVGFFGVFDVASKIGLPAHKEDFGQTLGVLGSREWALFGASFIWSSNSSAYGRPRRGLLHRNVVHLFR